MSDYLLTGCTGAIGTAVIDALINRGDKVIAVLNPNSRRNGVLPPSQNIVPVFCDMAHYEDLPELLSSAGVTGGVDVAFHLAWRGASGKGRNDEDLQLENVGNTLTLCRVLHKIGCKKFIGVGSQAEYGLKNEPLTPETPCEPFTEYGKKKLLCGIKTRELCAELGIVHIWVRVLSVYGKFDGENALIPNAVRMLKNGERPHYTAGVQMWDYLNSRDAANALILLGEKGKNKKTYVLGSGEYRMLKEYLKILHEVINPAIQPVFGEVPYGENQVMYLCADISELTGDTGFVPQVSFKDGIKELL